MKQPTPSWLTTKTTEKREPIPLRFARSAAATIQRPVLSSQILAMERVFVATHGRQMNDEERHYFYGLGK